MRTLSVILILALGVVGCTKHAPQFASEPVRQNFGSLLQDKVLEISKNDKPVHPSSHKPILTLQSSDWLDLSAELMESGDAAMIAMGHKLAQNFYTLPYSKTVMTGLTNPPGSPYAETAMVYAQPVMAQKYDEAITHVEAKVVDAAQNMNFSFKDLGENAPPGFLIEQVIVGLRLFEDQLLNSRDGNGNAIVEQIATSVEDKYIKDLQDLDSSAALDNGQPLSQNLEKLSRSLVNLAEITDTEREKLLFQVHYGYAIATYNEKIETSDDALKFLVDFWLAKDLRATFPKSLVSIFENLSEAQIEALATENQPVIVPGDWGTIREGKDINGLSEDNILAQTLNNNGRVLADEDWAKLQVDQKAKLDALLVNDKSVSHFAEMISVKDSSDIHTERYALVVNWLGLVGRHYFPPELGSIFAKLSLDDLRQLGDSSSAGLLLTGHLDLSKYRYGILSKLETDDGINVVKKKITGAITECVKERVNKAILPVATSLPQEITTALVPLLEKSRKNGKTFVTQSFNIFGRYYFGKDIFGVQNLQKGDEKTEAADNALIKQHPLPLYEYSQLNFENEKGQWISILNDGKSNAKTLGLGFVALVARLNSYTKYEGGPQSVSAMDLDFEAINKMLGIAGYRDINHNLVPSLAVSMTAGHENSFLDIRAYDPTQNVFAVPDSLSFNGYKLESTSRESPSVSVEGQMQLLRGFTRMMERYKPWAASAFDGGLGSLSLDEDPTIKPFLRSDYYLLSLALAANVVQNIPAKMLGVFNSSHQYVDATKVADISQVDAVAAVVTDYTQTGHSQIVNTSSLALAIDALSGFYEQMKEIERSDEPVIVSFLQRTSPDALRANIEKLISGFTLFSTSQLCGSDGGYYPSFDVASMKASTGPRTLSDQLLMEKALLHAGRALGSGFMTARAIDNFYFLNNAFWNEALGFYKKSEGESGVSTVRLVDVARAFSNISAMHQALTQGSIGMGSTSETSLVQMENLIQLWTERFFNSEILKLAPQDQVQDFSL